ncbi:MAG TPA: hypothetical protein VFR17_03675 [Mycobacterium sp.]|nr:hypothetical protein [Mycobacterium sp.]
MSHHHRSCRDCQAGLEHCHGTLIDHLLRQAECTEDGCDAARGVPHAFVVDCAGVRCGCAEPPALAG